MSHTPEPWHIAEEAFDNDDFKETVIRALDDRAAVAVTLEFGANNPGMREANARRIVACVNACASIPDDMVSHVVSFGLQGHNKVSDELVAMKAQRDELLAVLGTQAGMDVLAERQRQITAEGWTPEHDDQHEVGELATAAACYAGNAGGYVWQGGWPGEVWPWAREWWKPSTPRRDLVKSAAIILAEIERIDRAAIASAKRYGQPEKQAKNETNVPAIVFYPAGSLGEAIENEGGAA